MARRYATFFPQRLSSRVPNMALNAQVAMNGHCTAELGAPVALDADGILAAQSINAAIDVTSFAATYTRPVGNTPGSLGRYGRGVSIVLSGAGTPTVTIYGRDYLGSRMVEVLTGNGTNAVNGVKAFYDIDRITSTLVASTTIDIGWTNVLGLPFTFDALLQELKDDAVAANAGTFVRGLANGTAATGTNADVRGTYLPSTVLPNGSRTFTTVYTARVGNLHGNAQFAG